MASFWSSLLGLLWWFGVFVLPPMDWLAVCGGCFLSTILMLGNLVVHVLFFALNVWFLVRCPFVAGGRSFYTFWINSPVCQRFTELVWLFCPEYVAFLSSTGSARTLFNPLHNQLMIVEGGRETGRNTALRCLPSLLPPLWLCFGCIFELGALRMFFQFK